MPPNAVIEDRNGRFLYIFKEDKDGVGHAKRVAVEVGNLTARGIEVYGLTPGERVIIAGVRYLRDNKKVRLLK